MSKLFLLLFFLLSISSYGQDAIANDKDRTPIIVDNTKGWEWIQKENHVFHEESYPHKIIYFAYKSHPQYKVIFDKIDFVKGHRNDYIVYNNKGTIVRVGMIMSNELLIEEVKNELLRQSYIKDYCNNKYNFWKENTNAQNYVKKELKLIHGDVPLQDFFQTSNETAINYLERLKRDHEYDFVYILRCERLDNLSFEVIFGNENSEPTHKYKVTYNSKGTYGYDINVEDLPLEETDPQYGKKTIEEIELLENNEDHRKNRIFDVVEEMPQFPGGPSALFDYLASSIKYPVVAEENGVQGRVVCTFIVELDGSITDVKVVKSVDPSLDKEAIRVLRYMPRWVPGKQNGSPVRVKYTVPVTFSLG